MNRHRATVSIAALALAALFTTYVGAQGLKGAPDRRPEEGKGPFKTLAIRGVMLIDGTGAPPTGPVDVIVSGNRITGVRSAGTPGIPMRENRGPQADHEIDATGMYLMPGFVDMHVHAGGTPKNEESGKSATRTDAPELRLRYIRRPT